MEEGRRIGEQVEGAVLVELEEEVDELAVVEVDEFLVREQRE